MKTQAQKDEEDAHLRRVNEFIAIRNAPKVESKSWIAAFRARHGNIPKPKERR